VAEESEYKNFFETMQAFKIKQNQQKMRGLNDYNILTTVLNAHDEVRLHSRMIASFLDPKGLHYQGSLFLDLFLEAFDLKGFQLDTSNATVQNEFEHIDIYITDGSKHVIIENKIYAGDQDKQIKRYIEKIQELNPETPCEDILVIYLSIGREEPSPDSLDNFKIKNNQVFKKDGNVPIALYAKVHYKNGIVRWLEKCKNEVQNITNLNEVFDQYMQVVKKITNQYKGKVMALEDALKDVNHYKIAREIADNLPKMRKEIIDEFFLDVKKKLEESLDGTWSVELVGNFAKRWEYPLRIYKKEWKNTEKYLLFGFEFDKSNYYDARFGIVGTCQQKGDMLDMQKIAEEFSAKIKETGINFNPSPYWLFQHLLPKTSNEHKDFVEEILSHTLTSDTFVKTIMEYLNKIELNDVSLLSEINEQLRKANSSELVRHNLSLNPL
jgi:predicted nucleic acid-binding protein